MQAISQLSLGKLQADPSAFRDALLIDADDGPVRLSSVVDPWQRKDFEAIDPALQRVVGRDVEAVQRAYLERGRGCSKTTDISVSASWLLFASRRKLSGVCCAADKDQAALIRNAIDSLLRLNPWLASILTVQQGKIVNKHTGSELTILSSDTASSYGLLIDFAIVDELTHWTKRDLWDSIFSAAAKRRHCLLLVIANAGFKDSWQWQLREAIRHDPAWYFHRLDGPVASWITDDRLEEQKRLLPPKVFSRLWLNEWADGLGDALELSDIDAAISLPCQPNGPQRGHSYVAGLDIGLTRDYSALVVLGKDCGYSQRKRKPKPRLPGAFSAMADLGLVPDTKEHVEIKHYPGTGRLKLAAVRVWKPNGARVELEQVEKEILRLHERFGITRVAFDPWQAEYLAERLQKQNIWTDACNFTPNNLQEMATATLDAFRERQIELFPHEQLSADLRALRIVEKSYGYRLESPRTEGHGDCVTALAIALRSARQIRANSVLTADRQLVFN